MHEAASDRGITTFAITIPELAYVHTPALSPSSLPPFLLFSIHPFLLPISDALLQEAQNSVMADARKSVNKMLTYETSLLISALLSSSFSSFSSVSLLLTNVQVLSWHMYEMHLLINAAPPSVYEFVTSHIDYVAVLVPNRESKNQENSRKFLMIVTKGLLQC